MRVKLISHKRHVPREVEQDLSWYDYDTKTLMRYRGTRLEFKYDAEKKKTTVCPVTDRIPVYRDSWEDIEEFVKENKIKTYDTNRGYFIVIDIEEEYLWHDIEKKLRKALIRYEVED